MLFSSGWGLADVESNLHRLVSSLQQQNRGFFIWRPFGYNTDPSLLSQTQFTCHRFERPWRHRRLRFERRWLDDVLFGRPVCCRYQVTKLFPFFFAERKPGFSLWIFTKYFGRSDWSVLTLTQAHSSPVLTCYSVTTHSETQPHHYIPIHFTDSLIGYNICYYVTFVAVVTSNVKAKRCYEDGCIRHRTPTPAKTPASHPPLRRVLQPGELLLKLNSDRRTMRY